jgi:hypothetical protein
MIRLKHLWGMTPIEKKIFLTWALIALYALGLTALAVVFLVLGCGPATGDSVRAERIPGPPAGFTCFAIYNASGDVVGGNCLRD